MTDLPPRQKPYLIMASEGPSIYLLNLLLKPMGSLVLPDRIGTPYIPVDHDKVVTIIESDQLYPTRPNSPEDETSKAIAANLIHFLEHEVNHGRLLKSFLPIQSGIGNIANAVIGGPAINSRFRNMRVWTEVLQDSFLTSLTRATSTSPPRPRSVFSRQLLPLLLQLVAVFRQAPALQLAGIQLTRAHTPSRRGRDEHARLGEYLRPRQQHVRDRFADAEWAGRIGGFLTQRKVLDHAYAVDEADEDGSDGCELYCAHVHACGSDGNMILMSLLRKRCVILPPFPRQNRNLKAPPPPNREREAESTGTNGTGPSRPPRSLPPSNAPGKSSPKPPIRIINPILSDLPG